MVLLRRVIGDALRARRQGQHRTLREVSTAANVSLGYLSEIERGQKEASSELLAAICDALGARLSEVLREVSDTVAVAEQMPDLAPAASPPAAVVPAPARPVPARPAAASAARRVPRSVPKRKLVDSVPHTQPDSAAAVADGGTGRMAIDGTVSVSVRQDSPLKATLHTRRIRPTPRDRDVVCAA